MKLTLIIWGLIIPLTFISCLAKNEKRIARVSNLNIINRSEKIKLADWEKVKFPKDFHFSSVAFGENEEIVLIGNEIRISNNNGKTWKIIKKGNGFDRCTIDGGKTFYKECDENNLKEIKFEGDVNYNGDIRNPIVTNDGRLYFSSFYEHHSALWSIPIENESELWFGLHFTYEDSPENIEYWTSDDLITLKDKVFVSTASKVDKRYKWLTTDDKGKTWHQTDLFSKEFFVDKKNGIRNTENFLKKTTDGGMTWQILYSSKIPDKSLSHVFVNDRKGFACGNKGFLAATNDGGKTWKEIKLNIQETLYSIKAIDEKIIWIVGEKGRIVETLDGGKSWKFINLFNEDSYSFLTENNIRIDKSRREVWIFNTEEIYRKSVK